MQLLTFLMSLELVKIIQDVIDEFVHIAAVLSMRPFYNTILDVFME